jgi:hypothetical protein
MKLYKNSKLSLKKFGQYLVITASMLSMEACKQLDERADLRAFDYKGEIRLSLSKPVVGYANRLHLVASTTKNIASLQFCLGSDPKTCTTGAAGFTESRLLNVSKPRNYFVFNNQVELSPGMQLVVVGKDASGQVIDARAVEFVPVAGGATVTPSPNPSPSSSPTASVTRNSGGTGGQSGLQEVNFRDAQGLASSYKINAPADVATKAYGLHIHLHGDGGGGYRDFPNRETRDELIGVAVRAPNQGQTWGRQSGVQHARFLNELIQNDVIKKYNVDLNRIYFSGVSGGAYFLSGHFIPSFGAQYQSGAFLMCGGMAPQVDFVNRDFLKTFRIHWETTAGERRDITNSVRQSIAGYNQVLQGLGVTQDTIATNTFEGNGGHCEFDGRDYTTGIQFMMDKKFASIIKK